MIILHIAHVLIDGICRSCIPLRPRNLLVGRKHRNTAGQLVQVPRNPDSDMGVQLQRHILGQNANRIDSRINAVAQRKINNTVFPPKRNCRFRHLGCQNSKAAAAASGQQHRNHFLLDHFHYLSTSYLLQPKVRQRLCLRPFRLSLQLF